MKTSHRFLIKHKLLAVGLLGVALFPPITIKSAWNMDTEQDRSRGQIMLDRIKEDLERNYYDPSFHGMNLDARFNAAKERIRRAASVGEIFGIIAQVLIELDDSHTFFIPPSRTIKEHYGWTMQVIGERCFVTSVDKGSDAEAKGVKPGDQVLEAGGYQLGRLNLWKFDYLYNALRPQPAIRVVLMTPGGERRQLDLLAKTTKEKKVVELTEGYVEKAKKEADSGRDRFKSFDDQLLIWKMHEFDLTDGEVDDAMAKARKHKTLILDLRGNTGGRLATSIRVLSNLFERNLKIGDSLSRYKTRPVIAASLGEKAFKGELIVLVDSRSASASEVLARVVQLEKRGRVLGDQTAGAVMAAHHYLYEIATEQHTMIFFQASITVSDFILTDGKSLEHRGVTPDEVRLPSGEDLAAVRDPVLSYAASVAGITLSPEKAGKLFPIAPRASGL
jgi:carboxyl-terminal processing protease